MGQKGVKKRFSKSDPGPLAVLKQVFSAHVEYVCDVYWPTETRKML